MNQDDATALLITWLRNTNHGGFSSYGYDIYLPALIRTHLRSLGIDHHEQEAELRRLCPVFYAAAWDLCRRGIIRPGVHSYGAQATDDGNAGNGYSITPFGYQWLSEAEQDSYIPTEPGRFAQMLAPYQARFSPTFQERAQEAIRCYGAHAYLACCVMCGAAAEAILLATAIEKTDQESVYRVYFAARGRAQVENQILGQARAQLREEFKSYLTLVKYWRDEAAHGTPSNIKDNEAYTSLSLLLRFAAFVNDNWSELTS